MNGILLVNKPKGKTSFSLVGRLRKCLGIKKIGHAGTLDPFATGVMVMLIGREATKKSNDFLNCDKEYLANILLGSATDSYDTEGKVTSSSPIIPSQEDVNAALASFQGQIKQIPPMFSAKKIGGQKLYDLARKGIEIERPAVDVTVHIEQIFYAYPHLQIKVSCSKGTYIRSLAHDIGLHLQCFGHLIELTRLKSGTFHLAECMDGSLLFEDIEKHTVESRLI